MRSDSSLYTLIKSHIYLMFDLSIFFPIIILQNMLELLGQEVKRKLGESCLMMHINHVCLFPQFNYVVSFFLFDIYRVLWMLWKKFLLV